MSALPYHKRYHGDALTGFMSLTLEERGAYQTLLDMIYDRGGPIMDSERLLAGYMNCSVRKWRQLRAQLIEKGKITIDRNGMICNSRARKEIENQSKTQRKLIEAGSKGGRTRAENEKNANENNESDQANLEPASSDPQAIRASLPESRSQKGSEDKSSGADAPAKSLFDIGVSILTGAGCSAKEARSLIGKWRKARGETAVREAFEECVADEVSEPIAWLTRRLERARYVSGSGYEYRGDLESVIREATKRNDNQILWLAQGDLRRQREAQA